MSLGLRLIWSTLVVTLVALLPLGLSMPAQAANQNILTVSLSGTNTSAVTGLYLTNGGQNYPSTPCVPTGGSCTIQLPNTVSGTSQIYLQLSAGAWVTLGNSGLCSGIALPFTVNITSGSMTCGIVVANNLLTITPTPSAGFSSITVDGNQPCVAGTMTFCNLSTSSTVSAVTASGYMVTGGTGLCGSMSGGAGTVTASVSVPSGGNTACGINATSPYFNVSVSGAGLNTLVASTGTCYSTNATSDPQTWSCPYSSSPQNVTLTPGLSSGVVIISGSGACSAAQSTGVAFAVTVTASGFSCGLVTAAQTPQNGWWYITDGSAPGTGYVFQRDPNKDALNNILGSAFTYRSDGSPVWYMINAAWNATSGSFIGTAAEMTVAVPSMANAAPSVSNLVANVTLLFNGTSTGILTWTTRDASPVTVTKPIGRYQQTSVAISAPAAAPTTGWYNMSSIPVVQNGQGLFVEMQQGPTAASLFAGMTSFDSATGKPRWMVNSIPNTSLSVYPTSGTQTGYTYSAPFYTFSGGRPITISSSSNTITASNSPTTYSGTILSSPSSQVTVTSPAQTWSAHSGWGLASSPFWINVANQNSNITTPYVTFFAGSNSVGQLQYVPSTGGPLQNLTAMTPVALSSIAGGSILSPSNAVGGNFYLSNAALQSPISSTDQTCTTMTATNAQTPSPVASSDCNYNIRWQFLELGGVYDITYINLFSIPIAFNQGATSYGATNAATGAAISVADITKLKSDLGKLTTTANSSVVPAGWTSGSNTFVRVYSAANGGSKTSGSLSLFPDMSTYIGSVFPTTNAATINVANSYSSPAKVGASVCGSTLSSPAFQAQTYTTLPSAKSTYGITYNTSTGAMTVKGNGSVVGDFTITAVGPMVTPVPADCPGTSVGPLTGTSGSACYKTALTPFDLSAAILDAVMNYQVTVGTTLCQDGSGNNVETNGANDVYSVVVRDMLVGFASGLIGSSTTAPTMPSPVPTSICPTASIPTPTNYGMMTSCQWSNYSQTLFQGLQTSATNSTPYYNTWANVFRNLFGGQVYGFQYSDFFDNAKTIGSPGYGIVPSVPVQIVILND